MRSVLPIITAAVFLSCSVGIGNADEIEVFPTTLLGFVKTGGKLGIRSSRTDSTVGLEIFSEDQFRLAKDARELSFEELSKKYPRVADQAEKKLADSKASLEAQKARTPRLANYPPAGEPTISVSVDRFILLCTVLHVGEDYILVSYGVYNTKRLVIAKQAVTRIRWASDKVTMRVSMRRGTPPE